jgi:hypothetical protein
MSLLINWPTWLDSAIGLEEKGAEPMTHSPARRIRSGIGCAAGAGALAAFLVCGVGVASADNGDWATGVDRNGWWIKLQFPPSSGATNIPCTLWFSPGSSSMQASVDQSGVVVFDHIPLDDPMKRNAGMTCSSPGSPEGFQVPMRVVGLTGVGPIGSVCSTPPCPPPMVWTSPMS